MAEEAKSAEKEAEKTVKVKEAETAETKELAVEVIAVPKAVEAVAAELIVVPAARVRGERRRGGMPYAEEEKEVWVPKTDLGKKVSEGQITDINEILGAGMPIMESGLVDKLLPGLNEEVIHVRRVQRMLDSGRRTKFGVLATVGDKNGHVGVGTAKGVEAGPTIKKAISKAKRNIIEVPRSCASWECGCGEAHTIPFKVIGKGGSVRIMLKPAPKGVGLVVGDNSKRVLEFAGIRDVWASSKGHHRTVFNQAFAVFDALKKLSRMKSDVTGVKKHHKKE
jgi:small subunit ribosomal protein S5